MPTDAIANVAYALVAYPLIRQKEVVGVAVFADTLDDVEATWR